MIFVDFLNLGAYNFVVFYKIVETTNLKLPIRKRRFFSHPVILRGLMRGTQKVNDFLGCPAPKHCPEQSEGEKSTPFIHLRGSLIRDSLGFNEIRSSPEAFSFDKSLP